MQDMFSPSLLDTEQLILNFKSAFILKVRRGSWAMGFLYAKQFEISYFLQLVSSKSSSCVSTLSNNNRICFLCVSLMCDGFVKLLSVFQKYMLLYRNTEKSWPKIKRSKIYPLLFFFSLLLNWLYQLPKNIFIFFLFSESISRSGSKF